MARIINFHEINDQKWFEDTLDVIQEKFEIVPFSDIKSFYQKNQKLDKAVHLTIDDGHITTYTIAYPVLKKRGLTASIFVSPKVIQDGTNFWYLESKDFEKGRLRSCIADVLGVSVNSLYEFFPRSLMKTLSLKQNWEIIELYREKYGEPIKKGEYINLEQLKELAESGVFTIGAHTMNHPILANEHDRVSESEIKDSVHLLSELLGQTVESFAYPNGSPELDFGEREMNFLAETSVKYAFSFEFKKLNKKDNLLSIPRYGLDHGDKSFVRKKLNYAGIWEPFKKKFLSTEDKHRKKIQKQISHILQ